MRRISHGFFFDQAAEGHQEGGGGMGVIENVLVIEEFCKADSGLGMALISF